MMKKIIIILLVFVMALSFVACDSGSSSGGKKCAICGTKDNLRQITAKGDYNWYCPTHYADAWQYYYGK